MRVAVATLVLAGLVTLLPAAAAAKEGLTAELLTQVSAAAEPGSTLQLDWKLTVLDGAKRVPFNAMGVFVRLLDASGGAATTALARGSSHPDGLYSASVVVPAGGLSVIQIGVHGTTDIYAAVVNNPLALNRPLHLPVLARGANAPSQRATRQSRSPVSIASARGSAQARPSRFWARARPCASRRRSTSRARAGEARRFSGSCCRRTPARC